MPSATTLQDLYTQELRDLVSANEQMQKVVDRMHARAGEPKFKKLLENSIGGISKHTDTLRAMIQGGGDSTECRGMAGLVEEADRHAVNAEMPQPLRDVAMIAQYQRMSHYGVAGFGTAAAYAKALGRTADATKLSQIVSDIYRADEYTSQLAEAAEQAVAK